MFWVKSDRRGVASWGLKIVSKSFMNLKNARAHLWSTCRFEDMSAAKLAVGEEPRSGCSVK